eukprot:4485681-Prymnesium_polylepis.1
MPRCRNCQDSRCTYYIGNAQWIARTREIYRSVQSVCDHKRVAMGDAHQVQDATRKRPRAARSRLRALRLTNARDRTAHADTCALTQPSA